MHKFLRAAGFSMYTKKKDIEKTLSDAVFAVMPTDMFENIETVSYTHLTLPTTERV